MRSFGVLFAPTGGRTRRSLAGAAIVAISSFATVAYAQAPAGATGAAPGTAPNAPPPPAAPAPAGSAAVTPDKGPTPASSMPSGSAGALSAESVGQRAAITSYQLKAAEQNLTAAGARSDEQWSNYLPRLGLVARYTRPEAINPGS